MTKKLLITILFLSSFTTIFAQINSQTQKYRDDQRGSIQYRREGVMDGNLVRTLFYNNGEVGQWPFQPSGEWPKGTGHSYLDGVAMIISTEITAPGNNQIVHPLETSYREWMDKDQLTGQVWGLEPVPGYMNPSSTRPAMNSNPLTWPSAWPDALSLTPDWNNFWYGYFGKGVSNSDFETFFVMDDSKDNEFARAPYSYWPIPGDTTRGGLGLRVEIRGFQWSHVLAEDIIFWHYDVVNLADFNYPNTLFGFYTDCGVGGTNDSEDDNASYDTKLDLTYAYDNDGLGQPGAWKTGYYGYAYLESPGNADNEIDDDEDGMLNERRDDGVDNDGDWISYLDINGNGVWDAEENEPLNNDVGRDGIGPFDIGYSGPDEGEGDGIHTPGEPNFDALDKDESDQIGLTAVSIYRLGQGGTGGGWPKDDEAMWIRMNYANFDTSLQRANISMVFASGPFPLNINRRERFSMALVFGENLEDIVFNKETVQQIYNANYNFSKPPLKPTLTAVPGDGEVFLYWDKVAEQSRDPFLGFQNNDPTMGYKKDFEGYLIYRSTEAEFNDIKIITDSKGAPKYWKPIAQFDLIDTVKGPDPIGINGARFWRGDNNGLQHSYVDTDVKNGQRYYYAVVSYDMGDPFLGTAGLQPSECTKIISEDFAGTINFIDINCAVLTPNAPSAGYVPPQISGDTRKVTYGIGTGSLDISVLNPSEIKEGAQYKVNFVSSEAVYPLYSTSKLSIERTYNGVVDTVEKSIDSTSFGEGKFITPFDGMTFSVKNDTSIEVIDSLTGWFTGTSNMRLTAGKDLTSRALPWPSNYVIAFSDTGTVQDTTMFNKFLIPFKVTNLFTGQKVKVELVDFDRTKTLTPGDTIQILEFVKMPMNVANSRIAWRVAYDPPFRPDVAPVLPKEGDQFVLQTSKPFHSGDHFIFSTAKSTINDEFAKNGLSKISVVPNPYLGAATWERRNLNSTGRGERRIDFINLPMQCSIRIYTINGALVRTLEKDAVMNDGTLSWDLVTEDGMDAAYGVYIFHVDAPGVGEHIGKFAIIK